MLGAFAVFRRVPVAFSEPERRLIDDLGALIGHSLQRAAFRGAIDRTLAQLQLAVDVALDLGRSLEVRQVVGRLVRRATMASDADRGLLLRIEGGAGGEAVVEDVFDFGGIDGTRGWRAPVRAFPGLPRAIETRAPVIGGHYQAGGLPEPLRRPLGGARFTATVPLLLGDEVVAAVVLQRRRDLPFGPTDVDSLLLLGGPAALALRNSHLYAEAESASQFKRDFLDMAAHELRTPLTVISGYLSMLADSHFGAPPTKEAAGAVRTMEAEADRLRAMVDELLSLDPPIRGERVGVQVHGLVGRHGGPE